MQVIDRTARGMERYTAQGLNIYGPYVSWFAEKTGRAW